MRTAVLCLLGLVLAGCQSAPRPETALARFFLETGDAQAEFVTLPVSGVRIAVLPRPVITEFDIVDVEIAPGELGPCLRFQFAPAAARDLYRLTAANQGRRLVLVLNGAPLGAWRIDQPGERGMLDVFAEVPDPALPGLVTRLKETCAALHPPAAQR
jgi:hypothetical protein